MGIEALLGRVAAGDTAALDQLLADHRDYLRRLLNLQMGAELRRRVDPSDVIQETHLVVTRRIDEYLESRPVSFKLWLRGKALDRLAEARRKHVVAQKRSVRREVALSPASSWALAQSLCTPRPSTLLQRQELIAQTHEVMQLLSESDREILLLRHVEDLTNVEVAELLGLSIDAASKRYGRAILRLRSKLNATGRASAS